MSCEKRRGIEASTFLADPRSPDLRDFLDHYPQCQECSGVVSEWTALLRDIELSADEADRGIGHVEPSDLAAYSRGPNDLAEFDRERIALHLHECRTCADEFEALRTFSFQAVSKSRGEAAIEERPGLGGLAKRVGRSLLDRLTGSDVDTPSSGVTSIGEPAFAYQSDATRSATTVHPRESLLIEVVEGRHAGNIRRIPPGGPTRIGRRADCEVRLADPALERVEAVIEWSEDGLLLRAEHPASPPSVNDEPTVTTSLSPGDEIRVGSHRLRIRAETEER